MAKCRLVFRPKQRKNPTRWDGTYLYSLYTTASALPIFEPQVETFNVRKQFIWDEVSKGKFIGLLKQDDFLLRLCQFETTTFPTDSEGVNLATEQFTDVISYICTQSLRLARKEKKTKVCKKWIDSDCTSLRKPLNLLSHKKHRNPFIDSNLRHDYHSAKKNFKKMIKHKKLKLFNSQIDDLTQN